MKILVTGAAGFIGFHTVARLLAGGHEVVGLDSINDYYDTRLKYDRLRESGIDREKIGYNRMADSTRCSGYRFLQLNLEDKAGIHELFRTERFDRVCHLAAQAGVRYSLENPYAYIDSNITGFLNILEACRHFGTEHLVYASSSSVYGMNEKVPFSEEDRVDTPVSLYAATKRSNELMAFTYSKLYGIPATGLRFFTVYGPWGRPDMAPMLFASAITEGKPIQVFNNGNMQRDFTYIDDIVEGVVKVIDAVPRKEVPSEIYNIGCSDPVDLMDFIRTMEEALRKQAVLEMRPMQPGDVYRTYADTTKLETKLGYKPQVGIREGIARFAAWFREYRK